ncbi:MAG TPA: glycosyltransferase family 39 protein [Thermomicrobiales bacterium]|nr:glycosyltransferase family 39 protein [Thermomicrobiales bacterium]
MAERIRAIAGWRATLLVVLTTGLVAALTRLAWLAGSPPGFSLAEAQTALAARDLPASDLLRPSPGHEPLFDGLLWLTGTLTGWDVSGARLPAALLGIVTAVACALWYRRALGPLAGILGGVLAATTFPWLVLSRQAQPAIGAAALAALGLWCLWEGLGPDADAAGRDRSRRRGWWVVAAGLLVGAGLYTHPTFLPVLVLAPACAALLVWRADPAATPLPSRSWLIAGLACLLLLATPIVVHDLTNPDSFRQRFEQDWDGDGRPEQTANPSAVFSGAGETLASLGWNGHDAATLGTPGRALLDPIMLILAVAGLVVALRHPLAPLHGLTLLWLAGMSVPAALLDPGNPALLMPLTPALFLLPILGLRALVRLAAGKGERPGRLALALAVGAVVASTGWSLLAYRDWSQADTTYFAFDADLRDALSAIDQPGPGSIPVYIATSPTNAPIISYLHPPGSRPGRTERTIDSRSTIVIPADGIGYLATTTSDPLPDGLTLLLDGQTPADAGSTSAGTPAWQIDIAGQTARDRLPWTLPVLGFPDGFALVGFDIRPDLGDVATTGRLPDPPRVLVTLVWNAPRGATPHKARVRLLPVDPAQADTSQAATTAEEWLTTSPPIAAGNRGRELVVIQLSVPVPESPDLIVEVQAGLLRSDGSIQPPTDAGPNAAGDYVLLNRVQYVPDSTTTP